MLYFFVKGRRIIALQGLEVRQKKFRPEIVRSHWIENVIGWKCFEYEPKTNFDKYLEKQLKDSDFAKRFEKAGEAWM